MTVHVVEHDHQRLHVVEHGPRSGDAVLLIHGFPDSTELWRHQVAHLGGAGYRVVASDLRGFGRSTMPTALAEYHVLRAVADQVAILDHLDIGRAHVVGHDWGAAVAWLLAIFEPDRMRSLCALSVGHPNAFRRSGLAQLRMSFYMLLFQFEEIAEQWLSGAEWANFRTLLGASGELDRQVADLARPGRLTAALNWYRANMAPSFLVDPEPDLPPVRCPTLGILGREDGLLGEAQMRLSGEFVSGGFRYESVAGVGHWLPTEDPGALNRRLDAWLGGT